MELIVLIPAKDLVKNINNLALGFAGCLLGTRAIYRCVSR